MPAGLATASVFQQETCALGIGERGTGKKVKMKCGQQGFIMMYKAFQFPADTVMPRQLVSRGQLQNRSGVYLFNLLHTAL